MHTKLANDLEIEHNFQSSAVANKLKKTHFDYKAEDDTVVEDPEEKLKVNFYDTTLDMDISPPEEHFQKLQKHSSDFRSLCDIQNMSSKPTQVFITAKPCHKTWLRQGC